MADLITDTELLSLGAFATTLSDVSAGQRADAISAASSVVLSYLRKRYGLPLVSWSDDVRRATAHIAAYDLIVLRGFNPANGRDVVARERAIDARDWLRDVAKGLVEPEDIADSTASVEEEAPLVASDSRSGWGTDSDGDRRLLP